MRTRLLCPVLALLAIPMPAADVLAGPALLQIRIVDGEGELHPCGGRATHGLIVLITDETGKPVDNATVSFRLPDEGPSGTFASGLRSEIVTTTPDGRASVWGMLWNRTPGRVDIRITAAKGQARAGSIAGLFLSDKVPAKPVGGAAARGGHSRLLLFVLVAGASAAVGGAMALRGQSSAAAAPAASSLGSVQIGAPAISVGKP
ncbi:MAG: hypothetical protein IT160_08600 [Bryobacterales bacterium]|nr:hypothetical protein [Bryobacterales bacterium]